MGTPIHNSRPIRYQNNTNPAENMTLSTLESVINPFRKISVWKKAVSFLGSLPAKLRDVEWKPDYKLCHSNPELATRQWKTEIRLTDPYGNIYMQAFVTKPTKRKLSKYHKLSDIMSPNWRLGLYHAEELNEEGFDAYFQGGLRSDENFNAREYWERISIDRDLHLSRSLITSVRFSILIVLHKMITYGLCQRTTGYEKIQRNDLWLLSMFEDRHQNGYANVTWVIAKWMKIKGAESQKDNQICCGQFISKIARKSKVLNEKTVRSLSNPVYCRDLDKTTLRELIDSEDRLIPDIPVDDVQRVAAQRALRGAYNPPSYAQPQYDQYYQQYYPQQPPQQQHDDEEGE
ncbi:hypothetical protein Tco_0698757 [Tanacetum coccineum]